MEGWISLPHISFPGSGSNPSVPSVAKTVPSVAKTVPSVAKTVPSVAKTVPSVAKTVPSVAKTVPSAAKQSYLQGIQYMNSSSYSKALESYETAIQTYSNYSDAWNGKGEALESLGRGAEALTCFQTAVQIDPQACPAWINEGEVLESLGRYDEAMSCYNKALQSESSNEAAIQNKEELLDRGISDNAAPPPTKQYDQTHPLRVTGGLAEGSMLVIHIKEGEDFQTTLTVESGQPPYHWYLVTTNGVADSILFESAGDGSVVTVRGRGAYINDPTTTKRQALVNLRVEDSSQLTRSSKPNFQVIVDNTDDSAIAAQVARKWYQNNVGDLNGMLQQATAGLGYGTATVSYSSPIRRTDGYYQVTVTLTMNVGVSGYGVHISLPCILTIDTKSEKVTNVLYGDAKTSY
jgi:tetratricopeptide (TPR) repeat protein